MAEWPHKGQIQRRWKYQRIGKDGDESTKKEKKKEESEKRRKEKKLKKPEKEKKSSEKVLVEPEVSVSSPLSGYSVADLSEKETSQSSAPKWKQQKQTRIEEEERREFEEEQKRSKEMSETGLENKVDQLTKMVKELMTRVDELQKTSQSSGFCLSLHCLNPTKLDEEKKKLFKKMLDDMKKTLDEKKTY